MNPRFYIDGTTIDGQLHGWGHQAPWAVFDDVNQYWLTTGLPYRWMARLMLTAAEHWQEFRRRRAVHQRLATAARLMPKQIIKLFP